MAVSSGAIGASVAVIQSEDVTPAAVHEAVILLHPPAPSAGASTVVERESTMTFSSVATHPA